MIIQFQSKLCYTLFSFQFAGANPNIRDYSGRFPSHYKASQNKTDAIITKSEYEPEPVIRMKPPKSEFRKQSFLRKSLNYTHRRNTHAPPVKVTSTPLKMSISYPGQPLSREF